MEAATRFLDCQVIEKLFHVAFIHLSRMTLVMKEDVTLDPVDVGFFSTDAVMSAADRLPHLIKESGTRRRS